MGSPTDNLAAPGKPCAFAANSLANALTRAEPSVNQGSHGGRNLLPFGVVLQALLPDSPTAFGRVDMYWVLIAALVVIIIVLWIVRQRQQG